MQRPLRATRRRRGPGGEKKFLRLATTTAKPCRMIICGSGRFLPRGGRPAILAYLEAENRWFEQQMAPLQPAVDILFEEMKGRIEEDQEAVPWDDGAYTYRWRYGRVPSRLWERRPRAGVTSNDSGRVGGGARSRVFSPDHVCGQPRWPPPGLVRLTSTVRSAADYMSTT